MNGTTGAVGDDAWAVWEEVDFGRRATWATQRTTQ